jgi:hypothetical protein
VCDRFLNGQKAAQIARWIQRECGRPNFRRTQIYPLLGEGIRRQFFQLFPPREITLAERLRQRFPKNFHPENPEVITVVNARGPDLHRHLTTAAAAVVVRLVETVASRKAALAPQTPPEVHLGLGGGLTTAIVARTLARQLAAWRELPKLVIHTIAAGGFLPSEPQKSPVSYLSCFEGLPCKVEYVALFAETVVSTEDFDRLRNSLSVRQVMAQAEKLDIIVTSLASAQDPHGLLRRYLEWLLDIGGITREQMEKMEKAGWVGDVQFRPYSKEGPLPDVCGVRAVTLVELDDLVRWASNTSADSPKYIVLVAGPCAECGRLKTEALLPLLENPRLRVFTHLVTDIGTAESLLGNP